MNSLYVSDLDGTLLRRDETLSKFTVDTINELTSNGMLFSYATARSLVTAKKVTKGLDTHFPLIVYNGAFIMDNVTGEILLAHYFEDDIAEVFAELFENDIYPIVYAYIDGVEKFSFIPEKCTIGMQKFIQSRTGDKRINIVNQSVELTKGDTFYITCIDIPEKLESFYIKYRDQYHAVYQRDIYSGEQWLEIMPKAASKSNAIRELKKILKCERLVTFGDGKNDIDMFEMSDESYAVANADEELKAIATGIIESNNNDGVAKWLRENVRQ
ncbi:MAG: HAD family hydrolase [Lachnospiraceae bacterium]|nr:HAD family hydrolase [Lachnospiraceae bacterium]